jgi:hypothetical protein
MISLALSCSIFLPAARSSVATQCSHRILHLVEYPKAKLRIGIILDSNYLFFFSRFSCFFSLEVFWGFFLSLFLVSLAFDM